MMIKIGELAKRSGVSIDTLRFYEKNQLLMPSEHTPSGYRLYKKEVIQRVDFILRAKQTGLSLQEISELLSIKVDPNSHSCGDVKKVIDKKRLQIELKIVELQRFQQSLQQLSDSCCGGDESANHCSILEALEHNDATQTSIN